MVIEKPKLINPTMVPKPANGTLLKIQIKEKIEIIRIDIPLKMNPMTDIIISGFAL